MDVVAGIHMTNTDTDDKKQRVLLTMQNELRENLYKNGNQYHYKRLDR